MYRARADEIGEHCMTTKADWAAEAASIEGYSESRNVDSGVGLLTLRDEERELTFLWNGHHDIPIEVIHSDVGLIKWTFMWQDHRPPLAIAGTLSLCSVFAETCYKWIEAKEDAR